MKQKPTYSAIEIYRMCATVKVDYITFKLLTELIEEEIELYSQDELIILMNASIIMFCRCMLEGALNYLK